MCALLYNLSNIKLVGKCTEVFMVIEAKQFTDVLYYIALASTSFFVIKTLLFAVTGGFSEVFADFNTEFETETSFDFLSVQTILAFFMGFGWIGLAASKQWGLSIIITLIISVLFGFFLMFATAYLMFLVKKLNHRVVKNYSSCIGQIAKTYTEFKPNGSGQIEVSVEGKLSIENAINISNDDIKSFQEVKIIDYKDNTYYIDRI